VEGTSAQEELNEGWCETMTFDPDTYDFEGQRSRSPIYVVGHRLLRVTAGTVAKCPFCEEEFERGYSASEDAAGAAIRHVIDKHRNYAARLGWRKGPRPRDGI
jgi:hypothetical protein